MFSELCKLKEEWDNYHGWGIILNNLGRNSEAIKVLKKAVKFVDNFQYEDICCAYSALGEIYKLQGKEETAIKTWKQQLRSFNPVIISSFVKRRE